MAPRTPKQELTQEMRLSSGRVTKLTTPLKSDAQSRSYRMKRYKNGILNLEKIPAHLITVVQANATSPLLRLPAEIRDMIWKFACAGQTILLPSKWATTEKGGAVEFPKSDGEAGRNINRHSAIRKPSAFHLPEVSRQVCTETVLSSYRTNAFMCASTDFSRPKPMTRLMAAQRRAITILEPEPYMFANIVTHTDYTVMRILRVLPNICKVTITPEAVQMVQRQWSHLERMHLEEGPSDQEHWCTWILHRLNRWNETAIDWGFED